MAIVVSRHIYQNKNVLTMGLSPCEYLGSHVILLLSWFVCSDLHLFLCWIDKWGSVHTNTGIYKNQIFSTRFRCLSTQKWSLGWLKPYLSENFGQGENFPKLSLVTWTLKQVFCPVFIHLLIFLHFDSNTYLDLQEIQSVPTGWNLAPPYISFLISYDRGKKDILIFRFMLSQIDSNDQVKIISKWL